MSPSETKKISVFFESFVKENTDAMRNEIGLLKEKNNALGRELEAHNQKFEERIKKLEARRAI